MKNKILYIILVLFIFISLGYAAISFVVNINARIEVENDKWNVKFTNLQIIENDTSSSGNATLVDDYNLSYNVNLLEPGDYYEFTVDITNESKKDGVISKIKFTDTDESNEDYTYTISYIDGTPLQIGDEYKGKESRSIKVHIEYKNPDHEIVEQTKNLNLSIEISKV